MNSNDKGRALEQAVKYIEEFILQKSGIKPDKIIIESNKIILSDGVKHEIDLFVRVSYASSYEAIYLFECKNWQAAVGKNEIIGFSEKIRVTNAAKGFFVATDFGVYARAQSLKDPRIELVDTFAYTADQLMQMRPRFSCSYDMSSTYSVLPRGSDVKIKIHQDMPILLGDKKFRFGDFMKHWITKHYNRHIALYADKLPIGRHALEFNQNMVMKDDGIVLNDQIVDTIKIHIKYHYVAASPAIICGFDVKNRGTYVQYEDFEMEPRHWICKMSLVGIDDPNLRPKAKGAV